MKTRFTAALCAILGFAGAAHAEVQELPADLAHRLVQQGELVLVDVRTPSEWAMTGMPRDSVGANMHDADFIAQARGAVLGDLEFPVALICRTGNRSSTAAEHLMKEGFTEVYHVPEGMAGRKGAGEGWLKRGLPTDGFIER